MISLYVEIESACSQIKRDNIYYIKQIANIRYQHPTMIAIAINIEKRGDMLKESILLRVVNSVAFLATVTAQIIAM